MSTPFVVIWYLYHEYIIPRNNVACQHFLQKNKINFSSISKKWECFFNAQKGEKMRVIQNMLPVSKYKLKSPRSMTPKYIIVHNTANDASAANEVAYMIGNNNQVGYHYAVDDKEIVQGIPDNRIAWHAGDGNGKGNATGIGIEICYSKSGGKKFDEAEQLAAKFIAAKMIEHDIPIQNVLRHYDCSGKNCPHRTMANGWERFKKMIEKELRTVKKIKIVLNGKEIEAEAVEINNQNYIKVRDFEKAEVDVGYKNGKITIDTK